MSNKKTYPASKATQATKATAQVTTSYAAPKFKPVSDEITPYGSTKFRTPRSAKEFKGHRGSPQLAAVLDIDGTMQSWGSGLDKDLAKWCEKLYKDYPDIVFLIVTARDHEYMYETSFNWVMRNFPYAYIGPFCRAKDDPRYASEFKRELCQGFEDIGLYQIIAAADDNLHVIKMWKHWAETHFAKPEEFDLLECDSYSDYGLWRSELPSKGTSYSTPYVSKTYGGSDWKPTGNHNSRTWVTAHYEDGKWITGHWSDEVWDEQKHMWVKPVVPVTTEAKHRPAGTSRYDLAEDLDTAPGGKDISADPAWGHYLANRYGAPSKANKVDTWPTGALNVVSESPNEGTDSDALDAVIDEIGSAHSLYRQDLEDIVAKDHPDWTPEYIASLTDADLREEVGITGDDYRDMLYEQIANLFGDRRCDDELDELDLEEVEAMLDMTKEEIEFVLDAAYEARKAAQPLDTPAAIPVGVTPEEYERRQQRMDLEDLVLTLRQDLILPKVEAMDTAELHRIVAEMEAKAAEANADEAQNEPVFLEPSDTDPRVRAIVDAHLPGDVVDGEVVA